MMNLMKRKTSATNWLIAVIGPTAIGKTKISIELAKHFNTSILSADSRQFYKELQIGTAAPTAFELEEAPHHFIGNLSISDEYNVARYETEALELLTQLFTNNEVVILTGGSGLYIDAVCTGIDELPDYDPEIRENIKEIYATQGIENLRIWLKKLDPTYYEQVDLANPKRLMRAIEVCLQTGKKYSELRKSNPKKRHFQILKIGLNTQRQNLYDRINQRTDLMMQQGLLDEAKIFFPHKHLNPLNTVGYKELFLFLENKMSIEEAIEKIKTNTRRYAKRQLTWFCRYNDIHWFEPTALPKIISFIQDKMSDYENNE